MVHCVLVADRQCVDEMALPHWLPLFSGTDERLAASYFKREVSRQNHICVLWTTVDEDGMQSVRGFVDWTSNGDSHIELELPGAIGYAADEIAAMVAYTTSYGGG